MTAVYAGSFDPPTRGHLWMIEEGARLFDRVVVAVGVNPEVLVLSGRTDRNATRVREGLQ
jgi:pantetheine-phosphate adenylyltransferase